MYRAATHTRYAAARYTGPLRWCHYGRLAGLTNCKEEHARADCQETAGSPTSSSGTPLARKRSLRQHSWSRRRSGSRHAVE